MILFICSSLQENSLASRQGRKASQEVSGKKTDYSVFRNTGMHIWYGIKETVDKKLFSGLKEPEQKGYPLLKEYLKIWGMAA